MGGCVEGVKKEGLKKGLVLNSISVVVVMVVVWVWVLVVVD